MTNIIFVEKIFVEKIWGGNSLANKLKKEHSHKKIGEVFLISGIKGFESTICLDNKKIKLSDFYRENKHFFGNYKENDYPLLSKLIDANEQLSIQVHPDDEYAYKHYGKNGKNECWYIINAKKNAKIVYGINIDNIDQLDDLVISNKIEDKLNYINVKSGDFIYVPAGTIHSIGSGISLIEIQQPSDMTFRIFDFNRVDENNNKRDLHLKEAKKVINLDNKYKEHKLPFSCEYFNVEKITVNGTTNIHKKNAFWIECHVISGEGKIGNKKVFFGDSFILAENASITIEGRLEVIISYIKKIL